jgi:hypothetical protein
MSKTTGGKEMIDALYRKGKGIKDETRGQLLACGALIIGDSIPRVPVQFGLLKKSAYFRMKPSGEDIVEFGYTQNYAIYVHEDLNAHHNVGEAKYLTNAMQAKKQECKKMLTSAAMRGKRS